MDYCCSASNFAGVQKELRSYGPQATDVHGTVGETCLERNNTGSSCNGPWLCNVG